MVHCRGRSSGSNGSSRKEVYLIHSFIHSQPKLGPQPTLLAVEASTYSKKRFKTRRRDHQLPRGLSHSLEAKAQKSNELKRKAKTQSQSINQSKKEREQAGRQKQKEEEEKSEQSLQLQLRLRLRLSSTSFSSLVISLTAHNKKSAAKRQHRKRGTSSSTSTRRPLLSFYPLLSSHTLVISHGRCRPVYKSVLII